MATNLAKLSFHIPADEQYVGQLIQTVSDATGTSPSGWIYATVVKRLQEVGLLDEKRRIVKDQYELLASTLPSGQKRTSHAKHRSKKDS